MARKPRIHFPGAFYHVILRGNGGQDIFQTETDRHEFYRLIEEGLKRFEHRIHAFCLMSNHLHLLVEVGAVPLSRIIQNLSFRYTRYFNAGRKRIGHLFQGRYKALLIDRDNYLVQLVRYIHCNPIRARMVSDLNRYPWSSHQAYLGTTALPWLTTEPVLTHFSPGKKQARRQYRQFVTDGLREAHRQEFHHGGKEARILGDDEFSTKTLAQAAEKSHPRLDLAEVVAAVSSAYDIGPTDLTAPGKKQPAAEARGLAALLVLESEGISLTELATYAKRDITAMSKAAARARQRSQDDSELQGRLADIRNRLERMSTSQA